jgi:hypothetical protein
MLQSFHRPKPWPARASIALCSHVNGGLPVLGRPAGTCVVRAVSGSPLWRCRVKLIPASMLWITATTYHGILRAFATFS